MDTMQNNYCVIPAVLNNTSFVAWNVLYLGPATDSTRVMALEQEISEDTATQGFEW
jgi:hypothetical protein